MSGYSLEGRRLAPAALAVRIFSLEATYNLYDLRKSPSQSPLALYPQHALLITGSTCVGETPFDQGVLCSRFVRGKFCATQISAGHIAVIVTAP